MLHDINSFAIICVCVCVYPHAILSELGGHNGEG